MKSEDDALAESASPCCVPVTYFTRIEVARALHGLYLF